jgi:hypothetical protein
MSLASTLRERCGLVMNRSIVVGNSEARRLFARWACKSAPSDAAHLTINCDLSRSDAISVEAKCVLGLPFKRGKADVRSLFPAISPLKSSRTAVTHFFGLARNKALRRSRWAAADDQVETVVMHFPGFRYRD